ETFRPLLSDYAGRLLDIVDRHLRRADLQLTVASESTRQRPTVWRTAITISSDYDLSGPLGFLVDVARECIESLLAAGTPDGDARLSAWGASDVTLLRRLAIHGW